MPQSLRPMLWMSAMVSDAERGWTFVSTRKYVSGSWGPPTGAAVVGSVVVGDALDWLGDSVRTRSQSESFTRMSMKPSKPSSIATRSEYSLTPANVCPDRWGFEDV